MESDIGKTLTLKITGDGQNLDGITVTSNPCTVYAGEKPDNFTETLASWNYDYLADSSTLVNADESGEGYYFTPTSGQRTDGAKLVASVNSTDSAKIKWSGIGEEYKNASASGKAQAPVMGTSKNDNLAWGEYPYFETTVSTKQYENIKFSARLGGTKKGPSTWKLQYSFNGTTYFDIPSSTYLITDNKDMQQAFKNVQLPDECADRNVLYIRAVACSDVAINGINAIVGEVSGDAAINNVEITGARITAITHLDAPEITTDSTFPTNTYIFDTNSVFINDTNGGADVYYSINGGEYQLYEGSFNPFAKNAYAGDRVTVSAYSAFNEIVSETVSTTFICAGDNINQFTFDSYSEDVYEGKVFSNGGSYGRSATMSAYTDGVSQYVPLWNDDKGAFSIAPDDGAKWSAESGFTFEFSTVGYKNIRLSMKGYSTNQGPASFMLQYSLNGTDWIDDKNQNLRANGSLYQIFNRYLLPEECDNKTKVYVRVVTLEDLTNSGEKLHNNNSKGNLYINDIVFSGDENGDIKMPYTNKTSNYFGNTGTLKYYSVDNYPMYYTVTDANNKIILSGRYTEEGISVASAPSFSRLESGAYKVIVTAGDNDDMSVSNVRTYYYKGDSLSEFAFDGKKTHLEDYLDNASTTVSNSGGVFASTLSFFPNAKDKALFTYGDKYGIKAEVTAEENPFAATKNLDNPNGNGYYLIKTSTKGYHSITLNAEQLCSNKAPRDWGIAYSTNGTSYTYVANSNVRAVSNDAFDSTVETYNNFKLPAECDDKDDLYIKIFINGGESVDATELAEVTKGNCGINNLEISGIALPKDVSVTVNTYLLEDKGKTNLNCPVVSRIVIGDEIVSENASTKTLTLTEGEKYTLLISANGTFEKHLTFTAEDGLVFNEGIVALDLDANGVINAKDYAIILRITADAQQKAYEDAFPNFINEKSESFTY